MNYKILRGELDKDREDFIEFWRVNFPNWPQSKYKWFYEDNIYGPAAYWLARDADDNDRFIGTTVLFPKRIKIDGKDEMIAIAGDFGVEKKHRGQGAASMVTDDSFKFIDEANLAFIYATPNVVSEKVATRQGFRIVGRSVRMVRILRSKEYLKRALKFGPLASLLSGPVDMYMRLRSEESAFKAADNYEFEILDDFDDRFDELWKSASKNYLMMGERTREFLHWRFKLCPFKEFNIFAVKSRKSEALVGYIVYRHEENNLIISDLLVQDTGVELEALLTEFLLYQRSHDIDTVTFFYFGNKNIIRAFEKFGFSSRADNRSVIVYIKDDSPYLSRAMDENSWHFLEADNDT